MNPLSFGLSGLQADIAQALESCNFALEDWQMMDEAVAELRAWIDDAEATAARMHDVAKMARIDEAEEKQELDKIKVGETESRSRSRHVKCETPSK